MRTFAILFFALIPVFTGLNAQVRDLDFYLNKAREASPLINQARNENKLVALDLQQVNRILYKPEINLVSGFTFSPIIARDNGNSGFRLVSDGATNYIGHDLALTDGGNYQALVSLRQPLLSGSRFKAYAEKAHLAERIIDNTIILTVHELEQLVGYQYLLCLGSANQAQSLQTLIMEMENQSRILKKLVDEGIYKQTDLMLLEIEADNYRIEYQVSLSGYMENLYDLNLICGVSDTSRVEIRELDIRLNPGKSGLSGFLTGFVLDSLGVVSDQALNELKYKPQLNFFTDAGLLASYLPLPGRMGVSAGLELTWNIFDGHQREIEREKSAVKLQTLDFSKRHFMSQNEISKSKVLSQIHSVEERMVLNRQQAAKYDALKEAYQKELLLGEASVMDVRNLMKELAAITRELLQLKMEQQLLINTYNYLNF